MQTELLQRLLDQAFLYDDPSAYEAGVHAAWRALRAELAAEAARGDLVAAAPTAAAG